MSRASKVNSGLRRLRSFTITYIPFSELPSPLVEPLQHTMNNVDNPVMRWGRGWDPIEWPLGARTAPGRRSQTDQRRPASEGSANEAHLLAWPASQEPSGSVAPMPPSHRSHRATGHYRRILAADAEESLKNRYRSAEEGQPGPTSRDRAVLLRLGRLLGHLADTLTPAPGHIACGSRRGRRSWRASPVPVTWSGARWQLAA
jgi:hypothetical protein